MLKQLEDVGVDPSKVTDLYTEFEPCSGAVDCKANVIPKFSNRNFKLTYSFEWSSDPAVQAKARSDLTAALNDLWPYRK